MSHETPEITVLTRFHDLERLSTLDEMLFSLAGQNGVIVKSIVLGQNISCTGTTSIKSLCEKYDKIGLNVEFHNERLDPPHGDHRSEILNRGIDLVKSRYFAILDYDDVIYPSCYIRLIRRLEATECSIAFAGVIRSDQFASVGTKYTISKNRMYEGLPKARFFIDNQYPIHSYVIDLHSIEIQDLYFDKGVTRNEDYAFLYRILSKYSSDDAECARDNCEYRVDLGGSNTILAYRSDTESLQAWSTGSGYMGVIKSSQRITLDHKDLVQFAQFCYSLGQDEATPSARNRQSNLSGDLHSETNLAISKALQLVLEKFFDHPENDALTLNIESRLDIGEGAIKVSGWCAVDSSSPVAALFRIGEDATTVLVSEFQHRADVAEHLASEDVCFGFSVLLRARGKIKVIALSRNGKIYQSEI